jgi:hypothetical protein
MNLVSYKLLIHVYQKESTGHGARNVTNWQVCKNKGMRTSTGRARNRLLQSMFVRREADVTEMDAITVRNGDA